MKLLSNIVERLRILLFRTNHREQILRSAMGMQNKATVTFYRSTTQSFIECECGLKYGQPTYRPGSDWAVVSIVYNSEIEHASTKLYE